MDTLSFCALSFGLICASLDMQAAPAAAAPVAAPAAPASASAVLASV
jgi:hypothetical protein